MTDMHPVNRMINRISSTAIIAIVLMVGLALPISGCQQIPATGEQGFIMMSMDEEIAMGNQAAPEFTETYGGEIPSTQITSYVSRIGMSVASVSELPDAPWAFQAVDSTQVNAFALPGGKIFITRALLEKLESEAALAGVLAHEVGHVTARHAAQQMTQTMAIQFGTAIAASLTENETARYIALLGGVGGSLYQLRFSRVHEHQSDELGLRYMVRAGYDPQGLVEVMEVFEELSGGGGQIAWLSTHPLTADRILEIRNTINSEYAYTQNNPQFVINRDAYQRHVLQPLRDLPPAEHDPQ